MLSVPIFPIIVIIRSFFLLVRLRNLTYVYPILLKITQWAFHLLFLYILVRSWSRNYQLFELFYLFPKMRQFQYVRTLPWTVKMSDSFEHFRYNLSSFNLSTNFSFCKCSIYSGFPSKHINNLCRSSTKGVSFFPLNSQRVLEFLKHLYLEQFLNIG